MRFFFIIFIFFYFNKINSKIVFNEVMSNVLGNESGIGSCGDRNEFIELYNNSSDSINILNYYFFDGSSKDYIILYPESLKYPGGIVRESIVPPYSYIVILDPEYTSIGDSINYMLYDIPNSPYVFTISNTTFGTSGLTSSTSLYLYDKYDSLIDTFGTPNTDDLFPYQTKDGYSLEKKNPSFPDGINYYSESVDPKGNSIGRKNSVFIGGALIDSFKLSEENREKYFIVYFYGDYQNDRLIVEYENFTDTFLIEENFLKFKLLQNERVFNFYTIGENKKRSFIYNGNINPGSITLNEFMVKGFEWLEIYNPYLIDFNFDSLTLSTLNDTVILKNGVIPKDSYIVITSDTLTIKTYFPYVKMNLFQTKLFSLPDREDTFILKYFTSTIDSVVRGFENNNSSIERINYLVEGYRKDNWDNSISYLNATPSFKNSISFFSKEKDSISFYPKIIDEKNPILFIDYKTNIYKATLNVKIFDSMGKEIFSPYIDRVSSSDENLYIKNLRSILKEGIYILYFELKDEEKVIKRNFTFYVR
uniref:Lamin tail domain-containing protein n=1 Tax=candidate division WOR-3 bacterium TaxID=2052148 RepID=A0A7C3J6V7_UNCW3